MWTIYHNPKCSKSREALALLTEAGIRPKVVEYLKDRPKAADFAELMRRGLPPESMVRAKEDIFREHPFDLSDPQAVAKNLEKYPELLERPIVVNGSVAVVGRPIEKVKALLP